MYYRIMVSTKIQENLYLLDNQSLASVPRLYPPGTANSRDSTGCIPQDLHDGVILQAPGAGVGLLPISGVGQLHDGLGGHGTAGELRRGAGQFSGSDGQPDDDRRIAAAP